jgi:hypothetical protein
MTAPKTVQENQVKPQDLFLSLRDFFAVFVPGSVAIFAYLAINRVSLPKTDVVPGAQTLLVAAAAYGVGSVLYAAGARLDELYDRIEGLFIRGARRRRFEMFEKVASQAKRRAISTVSEADEDLMDEWSNKSFWTDQLRQICPVGSAELDRLESTQKFFRTFAIVLLLAGGNALFAKQWAVAAMALSATVICLGFYAHQRADWTYRLHKWAFLTLITEKK